MRGGEPMAFGVFDILPSAMFVHANNPRDVKIDLLDGQETVILVDSVINSGQTIIDFVEHIRRLHPTIRIVIVAGVVHAKAVTKGSLAQAFERHVRLNVVALRLSENKYTGTGTIDTGNRLFNTTHLG